MFAIDADSKCGEAGVIEVSEQFVREALEAKDQLKRAQRKLHLVAHKKSNYLYTHQKLCIQNRKSYT